MLTVSTTWLIHDLLRILSNESIQVIILCYQFYMNFKFYILPIKKLMNMSFLNEIVLFQLKTFQIG